MILRDQESINSTDVNKMLEIWADIEGYHRLYQVSNMGRIKSCERIICMKNGTNRKIKEVIRMPIKNNHGYYVITLSKYNKIVTKAIHRLVAIAFLPNEFNLAAVNHKYGNKADNKASQLEWGTNSYNERHSYNVLGKKSPSRKKVFDNKTEQTYNSIKDAANAFNIKPTTLRAMLSGQNNNKTSLILAK